MSCLLWSSVAVVVICVSILQWSATEKPVKIDKWDGAAVKNTLDDTSKKVLTCSYFPIVSLRLNSPESPSVDAYVQCSIDMSYIMVLIYDNTSLFSMGN